MTLAIAFTLVVLVFLVAALASGKVGTDTAMVSALAALVAGDAIFGGVIDARSAIVGFADPSVIMIAALFVVATGLAETGAINLISERLLGKPKTLAGAQLRMMVPVTILSAFMNNTPIVAMYTPVIIDWARKLRLSPSRLLMPLSFAAILGGACTLIGTSTNIAVDGLYIAYFHDNADRLTQLGLAEPSTLKRFWWVGVVGVPSAILGVALITLIARYVLPERVAPGDSGDEARRYTVEIEVDPTCPLIGKSIEGAGLRQLPGLFLSELEREGNVMPAVSPEEILESGDRLKFVGVVESVVDLLKIKGLKPATDQIDKVEADRRNRTIVEAVVSHNSPLVRRTVRESQFRTKYNAAIIAVHRGGVRIKKKVGDIILRPGDTLLLSTHSGFVPAYRNSDHFYLVSDVVGSRVVRHERAWVAMLIMLGLVIVLTIPGIRLVPVGAGLIAAVAMVLTRCCTGTVARNSINWQVLIVIAAAIGIGRAMTTTGAAALIAHAIFSVVGPLGPYAALAGLFLSTTIFAQLVTNKAAAVLMFPIAMGVAKDMSVSPEPFVIALMIASAAAFITPIGLVTNLMVYGPGGYRFTDYARLGVPLTLLVLVLTLVLAPLAFPFHPGP
ncbi:MAG: SLC13 family permease [Phycisphaerales bacterium]